MASQESDDEMLSGSDQLLIDTSSSDDDDLEDISAEDEEPAEEVEGEEEDDEEEEDDDDWDSDDKEDEEEEEEEGGPAAGPSQEAASDSSDCADMDCDRCPICLARLRDQDVGTPESCDHCFCLECIQEWAKNVNTCPVDRQPFHLIFARNSLDGVVTKKIEVKDQRLELEEDVVEDLTYCEVCGHSNREDRLLLCDGCDLGYHCECLDPALESVPVGEWFCPGCSVTERGPEEPNARPPQTQAQRRIGRTIVSERVRATIQQNRAQASTSARSKQGAAPKRRKKTKRRKQKRKATPKVKSKTAAATSSSSGKKRTKRKRRRKRKTRKMCRTKDSVAPKTVKSRLAGRLGITTPPAGRTLPVKVSARSRALTVQRDIGIAPLTIMAGRDDLDPAWSDSDMPAVPRGSSGGGTAVVQGGQARYISSSRYTKAALNSWKPIPRPHHRKLKEEQIQCTAPFDLLGDILAGQDRMNTNINRVKIHRDGSLEVKPPEKKALPSKNRARECQPNDTETTLTSGSTVDQQPPGGSGPTHATDNAQETQDSTDPPSNDVGGSSGDGGDDGCHGDEPHSGGCDAEPVGDCVGHDKAALVEKKCDENKKNKLKTSDENRVDKSEERTECDKDNSDDSCISCEGYIDNDIDDDGEMAINIGSDTAINIDSDIAISVDTTAAVEARTTSSDESCVSGGADKRQQSDAEHERGTMRQGGACEDVGLVCEDISSGAESIEEMDGAVRQVVSDAAKEESDKVTGNGNCDNENEEESGSGVTGEEVLELNSSVEEGCGVVDEEVHELRSSGEEESDLEIIGDDVHERQGSMGERSDHEVTGDDVHELRGRSDEGSDHEVIGDNVHELHGRSDEGSDHEVTGDDVHELHGSGDEGSDHEVIGEENHENETDIKEEIEGSVGSEERTESLPVLSDDADHDSKPEQSIAVADRGETEWKLSEGVEGIFPQEADDSKPDYAHYENISEVEEEEQVLEDGEETVGGSEEDGICEDNNREGHGSASMSHIMVPISELPRIPKKRKTEEVRLPTDGESPHSGVLERLNRPDKVDRYPKWEKRDRNDNGGKSRVRQSDSGGSDVSQEKPREDHSERREEETRHRRRNRSRSSSKEHSHHHNKSTKHRHSYHRSRSPDRERSRKRRDRSRERSRDTSRVSARSRSRSPRHRDEMRSKRDRYDRPGKSRQKSESSDYKGSVNMFSRSLKDVGNDSDFASRRFKLRRNSYKDFIPSEIVEPLKRPPSEKLEMYEDKYRSRGRKNVYIEDNRIKVKASVDDLHDDSSSSSSDVIIIESDTETAAAKKRVEKTMSNMPKMKTSVEKTGVGKTISDKPKVKSGIEITSSDNGGDKLGEGHKSSRSPSRVPSQGRQTNSWSPSSVTGEGRPTRSSSPSRVPSQWRQTNSWSPSRVTGEGRKTCSPSQGRQTHSQSPSRVSSQGRVTQMDSTDSCYDPCHPTDSVSPSPPEESPEPTDLMAGVVFSSANNGQGDMMHPGLRMQTPMLPVDPRIMPPPLPGNIIMPPPPHMTFGMLAPGVRPPPFLVNNHLIGMEQFPPRFTQSRLNWQTVNPMQLIQQGRHLVPVTRNGVPMPPPHSGAETFAMDAVAMLPTGLSLQHGMPPREDLGGMYRPPLPPMPAVNNSHSVVPQFSTSSLPNFMSTMKASHQSPGGEGNTFKVPFPPNHPRVMFSMSSDNHGDTKQVGSESNEVVDMDVSSPLSDDLLESFTPPPFHDDDDSKESRGNMHTSGKGKEEVPGSAVELDKQEKYLKKLNRQERVVEEVKLAIKPFYAKGQINKDEYKDIMRKAVPKICHSKSGNINPLKIRSYVQAYVEKVQQLRKYKQKKQHDDVNGHKRRLSSRK